jgi:hypothetical protein
MSLGHEDALVEKNVKQRFTELEVCFVNKII